MKRMETLFLTFQNQIYKYTCLKPRFNHKKHIIKSLNKFYKLKMKIKMKKRTLKDMLCLRFSQKRLYLSLKIKMKYFKWVNNKTRSLKASMYIWLWWAKMEGTKFKFLLKLMILTSRKKICLNKSKFSKKAKNLLMLIFYWRKCK